MELCFKMEYDNNMTVKSFLDKMGISRRLVTKLKRQNEGITCNGEHIRTVDIVKKGDVIKLCLEDTKFLEPNSSLDVPIIYESKSLVIFDKPTKMPVHPSIKHQGDTLGNWFAYLYPELTFRPINRLDRDTSGLCAVAKNPHAANVIRFEKTYYAIVCGVIKCDGVINAPIARKDKSIILRCVREDGQRAVTHYKVLKANDKYTLLEINLETGRTHQIRVHFAHIGFPLAGDEMYGGSTDDIKGQALHCGKLKFHDMGKYAEVSSNVRKDMKNLIKT